MRELGWSQPSAQRTPRVEQPWLVPGQADSHVLRLSASPNTLFCLGKVGFDGHLALLGLLVWLEPSAVLVRIRALVEMGSAA